MPIFTYMRTAIILSIALFLHLPTFAAKNIVLILADDMSPDLSIMGSPSVKTPNLDSLAQNGILFTQAHAPAASCSPCRSSINTGMYPHSHGGWRNMTPTPLNAKDIQFTLESTVYDPYTGVHEDIPTLPEILNKNGYFTGITFKSHMSPPWKFAFEGRNSVDNRPEAFKRAMKQFIKQANGRPFFIQANLSPPHRPFKKHLKSNPKQKLPPEESIRVPKYMADIPEVRLELREYFACVEITDKCSGAILDALREADLMDDTLIIFSADQVLRSIEQKHLLMQPVCAYDDCFWTWRCQGSHQ